MKKKYSLILAVSLLLSLPGGVIANAQSDDTSATKTISNSNNLSNENINTWMPDSNVQAIVMTELGLTDPSQITKQMMSQLTEFSAENITFSSFEGLQYASNLKVLSLTSCVLPTNFKLSFFAENTPLLITLKISNCNLSQENLSGYIIFNNLESLDISNNQLVGTNTDLNQFGSFFDLNPYDVNNNQLEGTLTDYKDVPFINATDSTIALNSSWSASNNFTSAQDLNGDSLTLDQLDVTGSVDTSKPGIYEVTYTRTFNNTWNNYMYKKVLVHVVTDPTVKAKDSSIYVGDEWSPADNFISATDVYGDQVDFSNITTSNNVDTTKPGSYTATYSYGGASSTVTIIVKERETGSGGNGSTDNNYMRLPLYRLYNPNSGEHFYTLSEEERNQVQASGWSYEGIAWTTPSKGTEVYRLYNPNAGEHLYTANNLEYDSLATKGWIKEGISFRSASDKSVPIYRAYNPNAFANNHLFTESLSEKNWIVSLGWKDEDIAFYAVK